MIEPVRYTVRIRMNGTFFDTIIWATNDMEAKMIAESQYGSGNVMSYYTIRD